LILITHLLKAWNGLRKTLKCAKMDEEFGFSLRRQSKYVCALGTLTVSLFKRGTPSKIRTIWAISCLRLKSNTLTLR